MEKYHKQSELSVKSILRSFKNAFRGFSLLFKFEYNIYIQCLAALLITLAGLIFNISLIEWLVQSMTIVFVLFSELINTVIEKIIDIVQPEYDERVRNVKDLAAGTVLFSVMVSLLIAALIYLPKIFILFM